MASSKPASKVKTPLRVPVTAPGRSNPLAQQLPLVSARWLLWSLAGIFGGGLALVYLTMVLLFWQGQWQILFHPDRSDNRVAATIGLPIQNVAFDTTETGHPQLDGWFFPAASAIAQPRSGSETILYLHSMQTGSLAAAAPELSALHRLGIGVFAFDYRGFGQSDFLHPSEASTSADVEAAWQYLTTVRHIPAQSIVVYGVGLGASLATDAISHHPQAAGLVMDMPLPPAIDLLRADPRSAWMPVRLLAHDVFDPTPALKSLSRPKLFFLGDTPEAKEYAAKAADPKTVVVLPPGGGADARKEALRHFVDGISSTPPAR